MPESDLRDKIEESGLKQNEVARRTGIPKGRLSEIANGIRNRTDVEQALIEEVLGCEIHFWNPVLPREAK